MILLGILALLLLVILLVLFNPFSYRAEGTSDGSVDSAQAKAVFHWLFHLISGTVSYKESRFHWHIRNGSTWHRRSTNRFCTGPQCRCRHGHGK